MDRYIPNFMKHKYKPEKKPTHSTEFCKDILEKIIQKKGFTNPKVIQEDLISATVSVDTNTNQKITVKIVQEQELAEKEKLWQNLQHHHVLPVVSYEYFPDAKVHLFYSPLQFSTLKDLLANKTFKNSPDAIQRLIIWCKQVASAIEYVHKSGYQHMNISSKCIAITEDETVKVKDFGYLQDELENNNSYGVASHACPPEIYSRTGIFESGDGEKFDTYCFGIMILEAFTGSYVEKKLSNPVKSWTKDAYPVIFKALRGHKFKKLVTKEYAKASQDTDLTNIRDIIASTLRFHARDRPNMREVFLKLFELSFLNDFWIKPTGDEIWLKKVSYKELQYKIDNMTLQNQRATLKECDSNDAILTDAIDTDLKTADILPCSQSLLNSRQKKDIFVETADKIEVVKPRDTISDFTCPEGREERKSDYHVPGIRDINMDKGMMGDHGEDTESEKSEAISFEHEDLNVLEISSRETVTAHNTKEEMVKIEIPSPFDEDDENNSSFETENEFSPDARVNKKIVKQVSEVFEYNQQSKDGDLRQKEENARNYEMEKNMDEKEKTPDSNQEKSKTIYSVKRIFTKAFKWILDEHLYSGVMNTGSYINKLSESLTD